MSLIFIIKIIKIKIIIIIITFNITNSVTLKCDSKPQWWYQERHTSSWSHKLVFYTSNNPLNYTYQTDTRTGAFRLGYICWPGCRKWGSSRSPDRCGF